MTALAPRRILCAVDLGPEAATVLRWAGLLARSLGAPLEAFYADWWEPPPYFTEAQVQTLVAQAEAHRSAARAKLAELVKEAIGKQWPHSFSVADGPPARAILDHAHEMAADLIVVGSHGRTGVARLRLGSVAEDVVRQSPQPVLVIPISHRTPQTVAVRHVLSPVTLTAGGRQLLQASASLAAVFKARLTVLHVVEDQAADTHAAHQQLCAWVPESLRRGCDVVEMVRSGSAAEQIVLAAMGQQADLIVLAAQHRPFLEWTAIGTTTERVLRHSPCPVLVMPEAA